MNLTSIGKHLQIRYNKILENINGLDNLTSISGDMFIEESVALTQIDGLRKPVFLLEEKNIFI